jgi:hypothetical protein
MVWKRDPKVKQAQLIPMCVNCFPLLYDLEELTEQSKE